MTEVTATPGVVAAKPDTKWKDVVGRFAAAIGWELSTVNEALVKAELVSSPCDEDLEGLGSEEDCSTETIAAAFPGVPKPKLNKAIRTILRVGAAPAVAATAPGAAPGVGLAGAFPQAVAALPPVPTDFESFIDMLRAGGKLKVKPGIVMSGIQVWFAELFNLDEIVSRMGEKIVDVATRRGNPVPPVYDTFNTLAAQRKYAEILAAIGVTPGSGTRKVAKKYESEMKRKVAEILIPAMHDFDTTLSTWVTTGLSAEGAQAGLAALMQQMVTGVASPFAAFAAAPADTTILVEEATRITDRVNQCFGGLGERAAAMCAHDAQQIRLAMQLPELPAALGFVDREDMLRGLFGEDLVTITDERVERSLVQWALAILDLPNKTEGTEINGLLVGMWQLRPSLQWDRLMSRGSPKASGIGSGKAGAYRDDWVGKKEEERQL